MSDDHEAMAVSISATTTGVAQAVVEAIAAVRAMSITACPTCAQPFIRHTGTRSTLVGYWTPAPHDHDPNAPARDYYCAAGHRTPIALVAASCPVAGCDHRGLVVSDRGSTFVTAWPEPSAEDEAADGLDRLDPRYRPGGSQ